MFWVPLHWIPIGTVCYVWLKDKSRVSGPFTKTDRSYLTIIGYNRGGVIVPQQSYVGVLL